MDGFENGGNTLPKLGNDDALSKLEPGGPRFLHVPRSIHGFFWSWLSLDMFRYPVKNFSFSAATPLFFMLYSVISSIL